MKLVPCVHCSRHVGVTETDCPFCRRSIAVQRPQFAFASKLTRAAIFSAAAVVGCDSKSTKPTPAPAPPLAGSATGSDDLEKMLDADGHTVDHPAPVPDAGAMAMSPDAGLDGGVATALTPDEIREQKEGSELETQKAVERFRKRQLERQKQKEKEKEKAPPPDERSNNNNIPMPYGAPPARRRIV